MRASLVLLLAFPCAAAEAPRLEASREEGTLRVRVDGGNLPEQAVLSLAVERMPPGASPVSLGRFRLVLGPGGRGEALYRIGEELAIPGAYRVLATYEKLGQYPKVLQEVGDRKPPPLEVLMDEDLGKRPYLQALLDEQAVLASAMSWTSIFLDDLARMKVEGLEPWKAWRAKAIPELESHLEQGKKQGRRFFPRTYLPFSTSFLFGLLQKESNEFLSVLNATAYHGTGRFKDPAPVQKKALDPDRETFLREAGVCRLAVLRALAKSAKEGRRADFDGMLALWASDPEAFADPRWKSLMDLAPLFKAWLDAPPEMKDAAKQALESRHAEVEAAFK